MPMSEYAARLVQVAQGELSAFGGVLETDPRLRRRIYDTYLAQLKTADPHNSIGWAMPSNITAWAWSATFVSWCVVAAGAATTNFAFSVRHAVFAQRAIQNAFAGIGDFRGRRITEYAPQPGDLIIGNRGGGRITYDDARTDDNYLSHSAVVIDLIRRNGKRYALTVGGNEGDSVRQTEVELTAQGLVKQRASNPYIAVIEDRMGQGAFAPPAPPPVPAGALPASFRKHGTFVSDAIATIADYGSADLVAAAMVRAGMSHAWVRIHGRRPYSAERRAATAELVAALKAAGVNVAGWGWCQGEDPAGEARTALRELAAYGLADYIADIEPGVNNAVWSIGEVQTFCGKVRAGLSGGFAVSSFALIDWHEPQVLAATLPFVDAVAPQAYWFDFPNTRMVQQFRRPNGASYGLQDPGEYADLCLDRWTRLCGGTPKPLILTGQIYWAEGGYTQDEAEAKLDTFLAGWSGHGRVAGLNWWHFGGQDAMSHRMLEAIVTARLGTKTYA